MKIKTLLIANRGEIACRIARTARASGITPVGVHSQADANALHVREIGHSVCIGGGPASESYLKIDAVIDAAKSVGADAIHPGYGLLSENPDLVDACVQNGITLNATLDYKGRVFASSIPTAQIEIGNGTNLGLDAAVVLTQGYTLRVGLQNTLQQDLEFSVGNRHAGRYAWAMLDVEFN